MTGTGLPALLAWDGTSLSATDFVNGTRLNDVMTGAAPYIAGQDATSAGVVWTLDGEGLHEIYTARAGLEFLAIAGA